MARRHASSSLTVLFFIILIASPTPSESLLVLQYQKLVSRAHSLMIRVAELRESREDYGGAARARGLASVLDQGIGLGFLKMMWSTVWDYFKNYSWGAMNGKELNGAVLDTEILLSWVNELIGMDSDAKRAAWVAQNYQTFLQVFNSVLGKLLKVFRHSGGLRELVKTVKKELGDGELLRDCLEVGSIELKGVFQILINILSSVASDSEL